MEEILTLINKTLTKVASGIKEKNYELLEKYTINQPSLWRLGLALTDVDKIDFYIIKDIYMDNLNAEIKAHVDLDINLFGKSQKYNNDIIIRLQNIDKIWVIDLDYARNIMGLI